MCILQLPAMSSYRIGPHGLLRGRSLSRIRRRPDRSSQAASSLIRLASRADQLVGVVLCGRVASREIDLVIAAVSQVSPRGLAHVPRLSGLFLHVSKADGDLETRSLGYRLRGSGRVFCLW